MAEQEIKSRAPLAEALRPASIDDLAGQQHLVGPGRPLRVLLESDARGSVLLWGPPGSGKTTVARILEGSTARAFVSLTGVASGVRDVREAVDEAVRRLGEEGRATILFIDEIHRFNRSQQDSLLSVVERGVLDLLVATTENPYFSVVPPLLSRMTLFRFEPLSAEDMTELLRRGARRLGVRILEEALEALVAVGDGDARAALGALEMAAALARGAGASSAPARGTGGDSALAGTEAGAAVGVDEVREAAGARYAHGGRDAHYDETSAFIKSIRGSDPDAGLYWLVRMLDRGEDPRFIARRLVILASEDVGLADPSALPLATAAAHAVELVGLPEAQLNLAEAVVYLACAPKSDSVTAALSRAKDDLASAGAAGPAGEVPPHLRGTGYKGAASLGHGEGYVYPHAMKGGVAAQSYRSRELDNHRYYLPSANGAERDMAERLDKLESARQAQAPSSRE